MQVWDPLRRSALAIAYRITIANKDPDILLLAQDGAITSRTQQGILSFYLIYTMNLSPFSPPQIYYQFILKY